MAGVSAIARHKEESRLQAEAWSRLRLEGSKADPRLLAQAKAWARSKSQAKAWAKGKGIPKGPTWAEYQAMEKRLKSIDEKIADLTWRLNLEELRGCFGRWFVESVFPPKPSGFSHPSDEESESDLMANCLDLAYDFEKSRRRRRRRRRRLAHGPCFSGKDTDDGELSSSEEEEDSKAKPRHVREMEEERSRLHRESLRLESEKRAPDFSGMTEADRAAEADRLRDEALQEASRLPDGRRRLAAEARARILDFDPKQEGVYFNKSLAMAFLTDFDLAEESPIGPMRFTNKVFQGREIDLHDAVNILSVKIACSDVGFPIQVYGTVIARDCTDCKRVYLFQRDREHCQLINSKDEPLILTGPKRGLLLLADNYVETDLMIKDHQGQDRELSKGVLMIRGVANRSPETCEVDAVSLATRLSTVKVAYAYVVSAVEATISMEVEEGEFCGIVTAYTTSIKNRLVLYDSRLADHTPGNGGGAIKMMRPVISVFFQDKLVISARVHGGKGVGVKITPRISNGGEVGFTLGTAKMRLRVAWSILEREAFQH